MKKTKTVNKPVVFLWMLVLCILALSPGYAQEGTAKKRITGKVTGKLGEEAIAAASVTVKGTTNSVPTNTLGEFVIEAKAGDVLIVTSVGYETKETKIGNGNYLDIRLDKNYNDLQDVVVVGYGRMKKTDLSSSQVTVSSTDMKRTVNTTLEQGLQGRAANVYVTSNSGQPGAAPSVLIRGISSINGTSQPLYVIDGVQFRPENPSGGTSTGTNLLSGINDDDIESVNILQGPSATAIYGSIASNGVILITTKRGKAGDTKISATSLITIQDVPEKVPVMNLQEYATYRNEFAKAGGAQFEPTFADPSVLGEGTDWQKALFRRTLLQKYALGLSGGNERTTFYTGVEYFKQEGVAKGSGFERFSARLNLDNQTRRWLKIGLNLNINQTKEQINTTNGDLLNIAIGQNPSVPVTNPDGSWGGPVNTQYQYTNPVALAEINDNRNKALTAIGGIYADITILPGLVFHNDFNTSYRYTNNYIFRPSYKFNGYENTTTESSRESGNNYWWGFNTRLQYDKKFKKHAITVMAAHESTENGWEGLSGLRRGFVTNAVQELPGGDAQSATNSSSKGSAARESWFGRANYVYNDRYIVQATIRRDGSANFGPENRWGTFPSVSAAWRISQESFMSNVKGLNDLKLRLEWGKSGNQWAGGYYATLYTVPTAWGTGYLSGNFSNPGLKWESATTTNVGFDARFFGNRLEVIGDFYIKKITDLLTTNDYPFYSGGDMSYSSGYIRFPTTNVGEMENKGFGITINSVNIEKPFTWKTGLNFSMDRNKITMLYNNTPINSTYGTSSLISSTRVGQPVALLTGYMADGLFQNIDQIKKHAVQTSSGVLLVDPAQGSWVGDLMFRDISGPDGKPDGKIDQNDRTDIGNPWPKFSFGFTNTFSYKNFDLSVLILGVQGNDIFNYTRYENENPQGTAVYSNYFKSVANFARPSSVNASDPNVTLTNPGYQIARITTNTANGNFRATQWYVEDGSYIRIKNVTLSYALPGKWASKLAMRYLKVSAGVQNLATFTKYKGYDPEIGMTPNNGSLMVGLDDARYPSTRMYMFSLTADF
ncbi:TonB-dependent receptor [Paraflavitalea sp. CAU 1676]|uniref:SusC/RagA family TonB-linked outer membrane protein n=1 Tax=Paraflavitalea sp. CAU 1676 TaxID=3032598 RepID=UPI0023DC650A|nr:TonB-dependent receptor [Paraflavitalea sp. CAU 1676]MDF2189547.1 TonB-dependent receptor [Paraflavitalea sp. CAU 1676]